MCPRLSLAALVLGLASRSPCAAVELPASRESALFQTATVVARPLTEATASVTVLDRETIEALGVDTVAELIRFMPGLDLVSGGPRGGLAVAQVRGGDPNFTVVLLDGVPLNDATDLLRGGAVNLNGLPAAMVERIEVVRGPLSSFFGSAALGGVINVITRRGAGQGTTALDLAAGDASMRQASASWSASRAQHDGFVGATWGREEHRVAQDSFKQVDARGNFGVELSERSKLRVSGRVASWDTDDYPDLSGGPVYGDGQTRHSEHDEWQLGAEWLAGPPERTHRVFVAAYRHDLARNTPATPPFAPPIVEDTRYTRWRGGWSAPVLTKPGLQLSAGAEIDREQGRNDSMLEVAPGFSIPGSYRMNRTTGGAFMNLLAERGPALIELGARVDVPEGFSAEVSPRAGATFKLGDGQTRVRLSASQGFKLPSFFVLASPSALGGNPDLKPERALGFDAGVERRFHSTGLTAGLTLFHDDYKDLIDFELQPDNSVVSKNLNQVRAQGAEGSLGWTHESVAIQASVTRQNVENRDTGQSLRNRPDWIAGAHASWRATQRLRWTVDGQWASESLDFAYFGRDSTAGYQLYGTALQYDVAHDLELRARVDNLADKDYETFIGFPGPGRSFSVDLHWQSR